MNVNITVKMMKKILGLFLAVCLIPVHIPEAAASVGSFEEIQMLKGDVYTVVTKGLQRVSITDPNVADISDAKPEHIILVGQQPGQTVLFVWDEAGKRSFIVQVLAEDLGLIKARIKMILQNSDIKGVTVEQNDMEGKVMLTGTLPADKVENVAKIADSFPGSILNLIKKEEIEDMVQLDMQITELSTTLSKELGVTWNEAFNVQEDNTSYKTGKFKDVFKIGDVTRSTALIAKINALIQEGKGHILSKPRLVVKNGKEATFLVGGEIPIKTTTVNSTGGASQENVTFKSYGVSMGMTPTIKAGKVDVLLNVEISDIDGSTAQGADTAFLTRSAQTQLFLDDRQTIVLAGLIKKRNDQTVKRVPFLSKVPVVGMLFRNTKIPAGNGETEVVISITPTIIKTDTKPEVVLPEVQIRKDVSVVKEDDLLVMNSGRNGNQLPVIVKNAGDVPVTISENLKPYAEAVQQRVSSAIAYPYEAQENGWQGTVKIGMVIRKDGSLRDVFVKESSGYDVFDLDAVNTAQILAPYGPFPVSIPQEEITVTLPIVYSLDAFLKNVAKHK